MNTKRSTKFSVWPIMRKLHPLKKSGHYKVQATGRLRSIVVGVTAHSGVHTMIALCLIALLVVLNIVLRFPNLGAIIAQYNQFYREYD